MGKVVQNTHNIVLNDNYMFVFALGPTPKYNTSVVAFKKNTLLREINIIIINLLLHYKSLVCIV